MIVTPLVLLVGVGAVLAYQVEQLSTTAHLLDHSDAVIGKLYDLQKEIIDQETGLRGYLVTGDRAFLEPYEKAHPLSRFAAIRVLMADNPAQQVALDDARARYDDWLHLSNGAVEHNASLDAFRSVSAMFERKNRMDSVREAIGELLTTEQSLKAARAANSEDAKRTTGIVSIPLFVGLGVALAFFSRRQMSELAKTYGDALAGERETRRVVEDQNWIRQQLVLLAQAIQGEPALEELGRRALDALTRSVGAVVGAFYVGEPGGYRLRAGYALENSATEWIVDGEGLVGQAAVGQRLVQVKNVPDGFLKVSSGTGNHDPAEVALVPACLDGTPLAVLEFGFFGEPEPRAVELLDRVGEMIAMSLRSVLQKSRLRDLLEESQRQGEELQTQQEELRVANEELQHQSDALLAAHAQLEERKEELETSNANLVNQRDALERAQRDLEDKADELRKTNRYKSEFLANMSHELRTPLNSSLILAKLLGDNKGGNLTEEQVKFANTIYSAGNDLLALINDILDLSKIEAGKIDIHAATVSLTNLVEPVARMFEPVAQKKAVVFVTNVADGARTIDTDAARVQQILKNLLSNAFKFTERGEVRLTVERTDDGVRFLVHDTGIGIDKAHHESIFAAFQQADGTTNRKFGGTGLGLSISRDLARLLGGDLTVESEIGKGSTFTLTLPLAYAGPRLTDDLAPETPKRLPPAIARKRAARTLPPKDSTPVDDRDHLDPKRRLLLVVEDDESFADILAKLAGELDFQVLLANNAEDGLRLAFAHLPSAIVLDVNLPDHSGLSVLDRLKQNPSTRHIPVHVVSVEDYSQTALSMGAVGYLLKPVQREDLIHALSEMRERFARVRRLLVVEDDQVQRAAIGRLLEAENVEIVATATVSEALAALSTQTFDCVVTDLSLPDASGYELLEKMANDEAYAFPPVIVYTGRTLSAEEEQRLRRHSNSIIVKGARSPERLLDEVTLFLHQVESDLPPERQRMLRQVRDRDAVFEGRKILVAEDDVRNVFALTSVLESKGAELVIARNGKEALELLEANARIDLVLMDIMMPEMDGIEATRLIRKDPQKPWAKVPIIALTAKAMRDDQERCLQAGANDYIAKPLDVDVLLSLVRVWMPK